MPRRALPYSRTMVCVENASAYMMCKVDEIAKVPMTMAAPTHNGAPSCMPSETMAIQLNAAFGLVICMVSPRRKYVSGRWFCTSTILV